MAAAVVPLYVFKTHIFGSSTSVQSKLTFCYLSCARSIRNDINIDFPAEIDTRIVFQYMRERNIYIYIIIFCKKGVLEFGAGVAWASVAPCDDRCRKSFAGVPC